jgi:hypothetical protein
VPPAALTPELALRRVQELCAEVRGAVLLDAHGSVVASLPADVRATDGAGDDRDNGSDRAERLGQLVLAMLRAADSVDAAAAPWAQVEVVAPPAGGVFALRSAEWTIAVVTRRDVLASLLFLDLRSVLAALAPKPAAPTGP